MPILEIEGRRVEVDDSFLSLPPEQQQATVEEIAGQIGIGAAPESDAARQFREYASAATQNPAKAKYDAMPEWQKPLVAASDFVNLAGNGALFNWGDEIAAGIRAPFTDKSYSEELDALERRTTGARRRSGIAGTAAEIGGGLASGLGLASRGLSLGTNAATGGQGLLRTAIGGAADGAVIGGLTGAGSEGSIEDRAGAAAKGLAVGTLLGGTVPVATAGISAAAAPVLAPVMARLRPQGYANRAVDEGLRRAGMTADDVGDTLQRSAADGQPMFNVADAMGHSGRRMLSTVARTPNDARQEVVDTLVQRQMGQGERLSNALAEGFAAPDTALQRAASLTAARDTASDAAFSAARQNAGAVDVSAAIQAIDDVLQPGVNRIVNPGSNIANDTVESVLSRARSMLTDGRSNLTDFNAVFRARQDIADWAQAAQQAGRGNQARLLRQVRGELDNALAASSVPYRAAMQQHATASRVIDAVDTGRTAAGGRTRASDNINQFGGMSGDQQSAFRAGYADPMIARVEAASNSPTTNKARMLMTEKTGQEFPVFAEPGKGGQMGRRISREQRMFETANAALGGSKTADNLADMAEMAKFDPGVITALLRGRPVDAAVAGVTRLINEARGMPPSVIQQVARTLLETNPAVARQLLSQGARQAAQGTRMRALANAILTYSGASASGRLAGP